MSQSCETLITKINEWQKAILELENIADKFLNSGDEKIKPEIDAKRQEIKKLMEEYQELAYPELPNGEKLFWLEKEMLEEITRRTGWDKDGKGNIEVKGYHVVVMDLTSTYINWSQFSIDFSLFHNLEEFDASFCQLKKLPRLPASIRVILISGNQDITEKEKERIKKEYPNTKIYF